MREPVFYGAVHILFYRAPDEVLLLLRQNTGFADGSWSVVAGRIDGGEEVKAAAIREAREEAGVHIEPEELELVGVYHRKNTRSEWIDFYLIAHSWSGEIVNCEPHKCGELRWFRLDELPENTVPYIRNALLKNHEHLWFESVGWS